MDGTRHSRIVPRDRHWHQHMAAATHWLHLVETAARADTGHLCARVPAWDWDRQRYTDLVGTGHLPRKPCPGRLAPLPESALFERQTQARSRASCHSSSQRGRCSAEQPSGAERWEGCSNAYDVTESGRRCSCHEPPHTCRGLVASLCLNSKGDPSALASMTATSPWERTPKIYGTMTRYQSLPTVAEPLASKERYQSTKNVLASAWHSCSEPVRSVGKVPCRRTVSLPKESALAYRQSIAQMYKCEPFLRNAARRGWRAG